MIWINHSSNGLNPMRFRTDGVFRNRTVILDSLFLECWIIIRNNGDKEAGQNETVYTLVAITACSTQRKVACENFQPLCEDPK